MTREQYLTLKAELKEKGKQLRSLKHLFRAGQSSIARGTGNQSGNPIWKTRSEIEEMKRDFRSKHIFMSLLRGKTRTQIEHNFEEKYCKRMSGMYSWLEAWIKKLCEIYQVEYELDEFYNIVKILSVKENRDVA